MIPNGKSLMSNAKSLMRTRQMLCIDILLKVLKSDAERQLLNKKVRVYMNMIKDNIYKGRYESLYEKK